MNETLTDYLINIFGQYNPIAVTDPNTGDIIDLCIDWGYICSVIIFCIVLYAVLKCVGGVIRAICSK